MPKPRPSFETHAPNKKVCHVHASQAVAACHLLPPKIVKNILKLNSSICMNRTSQALIYFRGGMTETFIIEKSKIVLVHDGIVVTIFHKGLVSAFT